MAYLYRRGHIGRAKGYLRILGRITMKRVLLYITGTILITTLIFACTQESSSTDKQVLTNGKRVLLVQDILFEAISPFAQFGSVWGNRETQAHGTSGIFPGGAASPPHVHTYGYYGVVLSGNLTNPFGTEVNPTELGPGSYWYVPAMEEHVTVCISEEPCTFYFHASNAFDFTVIETPTKERSSQAVSTPAQSIQFEEVAPFVDMATIWGSRETGAHGTFGIFKPNSSSPPHFHNEGYYGVVISGEMTNPFPGEDNPPILKTGSYWYVPAGEKHITTCISQEPCHFYFHSEGAFDFVAVDSL